MLNAAFSLLSFLLFLFCIRCPGNGHCQHIVVIDVPVILPYPGFILAQEKEKCNTRTTAYYGRCVATIQDQQKICRPPANLLFTILFTDHLKIITIS